MAVSRLGPRGQSPVSPMLASVHALQQRRQPTPPRTPPRSVSPSPALVSRDFRVVRSTTPPRSTTPRSVVTTPQLQSRDLLSMTARSTSSPAPPLAFSAVKNSPWSQSQHSRNSSPSGARAGGGTALG